MTTKSTPSTSETAQTSPSGTDEERRRADDASRGIRRYTTDDCDLPEEEQHDLVILDATGSNGDWYVGVWPKGARYDRHMVRLRTSGGASTTAPGLTLGAARMYRALAPREEARQEVLAELAADMQALCPHPEESMQVGADGCATCQKCGDAGFPVTPEAAGQSPCCGGYGECVVGCTGEVSTPWALAKRVQEALLHFAEAVRPITPELETSLAGMLSDLKLIRYDGHQVPEKEGA